MVLWWENGNRLIVGAARGLLRDRPLDQVEVLEIDNARLFFRVII